MASTYHFPMVMTTVFPHHMVPFSRTTWCRFPAPHGTVFPLVTESVRPLRLHGFVTLVQGAPIQTLRTGLGKPPWTKGTKRWWWRGGRWRLSFLLARVDGSNSALRFERPALSPPA